MFNWFRRKQKSTQANEPPLVTGAIEGSRAHRAAKLLNQIDRSDPLVFENVALSVGKIARFYLDRLQYEGTMVGPCRDLPRHELLALADEIEKVADHHMKQAQATGDTTTNGHAAGLALLSALFDIHSRDEHSDAEKKIAARIRSMSIAGHGAVMRTDNADSPSSPIR